MIPILGGHRGVSQRNPSWPGQCCNHCCGDNGGVAHPTCRASIGVTDHTISGAMLARHRLPGQSRGHNQWWHMVRVVSGGARVGAASRTVARVRRTRGAKYGDWRCGKPNVAGKERTRKVSPVKKILASEQISRTAPKKAVAVKTALRKALPTCEIQIPVEKWESITLDHMPGPKAESRNHVKRNCAKRRKDEFT